MRDPETTSTRTGHHAGYPSAPSGPAPARRSRCPRGRRRSENERGLSVFGLLGVVAAAGVLVLPAGALTERLYHRYQLTSAVADVRATVLATRMLAVRSGANAICSIDVANRRVVAWVDTNGNFVQDADEPTRVQFAVPAVVVFSSPFGAGGDKDGVIFDTYGGNRETRNMIVFRPDGSVVEPECVKCNPPRLLRQAAPDVPVNSVDCRGTNVPSTGLPPLHGTYNSNNGMGCRGVYMARVVSAGSGAPAVASDDVFRVSVDQGRSGRVTVLKWIGPKKRAGLLFVPPDPAWTWFD